MKNIKDYAIDFESLPWESPAPGVRFKAFVQGPKKIRIIEFTEEYVEPAWCSKGHIGYVVEGEMEVEFEGAIRKFKGGDGLFIPKGDENKHRHYSTSKPTTLFLVEDA